MEMLSKNLLETEEFARRLLKRLASKKTNEAVVLGLCGDLGSGKTAFAKAFGKCLGVREEITSPTFVIRKSYKTNHRRFSRFVHIDAYRLESGKEMEALDFEKDLKSIGSIVLIEWPERVANVLPKERENLFFEFIDETSRKIVYE